MSQHLSQVQLGGISFLLTYWKFFAACALVGLAVILIGALIEYADKKGW